MNNHAPNRRLRTLVVTMCSLLAVAAIVFVADKWAHRKEDAQARWDALSKDIRDSGQRAIYESSEFNRPRQR